MAAVTLAAIASSLTTRFRPEIESQINRATVLPQLLPTGDGTTGKRLDWVVSMGTGLAASRAEGAAVGTPSNDDKVPATLEYANIDDSFQVTGKALRAAAAAGNPAQLAALFAEEIRDCNQRVAKYVAQQLYTGSGAANNVHGLTATAGPMRSTGIYANIDRSSFAQWASNEFTNGGIPRSLSKTLMRRVRRAIYVASGMKPDLIVCSPAIHEKYGETFNVDRRYVSEITLRGQKITLDGGYQALEFDGIPVIEDVDSPDEMLFLNTSVMAIRQLPDIGEGNPPQMTVPLRGTPEEQFGDRPTGLTGRINALSRDGDFVRFQLILYPQLQVRRCNALGRLADLDIT